MQRGLWSLAGWMLLPVSLVGAQTGGPFWHVESDPHSGSSAAVIVTDSPLIHTTQLLPVDESRAAPPNDTADAQFAAIAWGVGSSRAPCRQRPGPRREAQRLCGPRRAW